MRYKVSYIFNLIIFTLVLLSTIMMFIGFNFMGNNLTLSATKIETFKYFTVDSNILMGITSLIFACYEYLVMKNKRESIPISLHVIKLISTVCVMLTFLVTLFYLTPKFSNPLVLYKK